MKKVRIIAALCMIAMLFVACSPAPEKDEPVELVIPEWADGDYTGSIMIDIGTGVEIPLPVTLNINSENKTFAVAVTGLISIDSSAEGVEIKECTVSESEWSVVLDGVVTKEGTDPINNISVEIVPTEDGHLTTTVTMEGLDVPVIDFAPVAAEPVPEN